MKQELINIEFLNLVGAYIFILLLLWIVAKWKISEKNKIILATIRMTLQLVGAGYVLSYLFENPHPLLTILVVLLMEIFAVYTIIKQLRYKLSLQLIKWVIFSMFVGTVGVLGSYVLIIIQPDPWFEPRYMIPLAGMIIGNSMTGITLGINELIGTVYDQRERMEASLMMGAEPKQVIKPIINKSFGSAILPTINSMLGMGIIFLPGMMTGQILAGASPLTAIEYQIAIMLGIVGSVTLTTFIFLVTSSYAFFTNHNSLTFRFIKKSSN